jgi:hypothetical protein
MIIFDTIMAIVFLCMSAAFFFGALIPDFLTGAGKVFSVTCGFVFVYVFIGII